MKSTPNYYIFKKVKHHARAPMRQSKAVNTFSYQNTDQVRPHSDLSGRTKKALREDACFQNRGSGLASYPVPSAE